MKIKAAFREVIMRFLLLIPRILLIIYRRFYRHFFPIEYARSMGVRIGRNCYLNGVDFGSEPYLITLGDNVGATEMSFVTHDGAVRLFRDKYPDLDVLAPIKVGNNVFMGMNSIVMPGVTIGDNINRYRCDSYKRYTPKLCCCRNSRKTNR